MTTFEKCYRSQYPRLVYAAYSRVRNWQQAEDIAQEALARLWEHRHEVNAPEEWLFIVSRNLALTHIYSTRPPRTHRQDRWRHNLLEEDLVASFPDLDTIPLLCWAWAQLTPLQQSYLWAQHAGYTCEEIAKLGNTTIEAVKAAIHRARAKVRNRAGV